jgi:hypothetical protein
MRQVIGLTISGLAIACAAIAVVLGGHLIGRPTRSPASERETITLTAARASYLSPTRLTEITGATIEVTDTIRGAAEAGFPQIAVWTEVSSVYDTTNRQSLEPMSRTFAFDRATAELVNCCDQNINGDAVIPQRGIAGWVFPRIIRKQTYDVFDTTLDAPEPFAYSGTDTVSGIRAYRFEEHISAAPAGFSLLSRTEPELYSMHRTYWVDPATGALLKISENEDLYLVRPATHATVTHLFDADLSTTPATVAGLVRQDTRGRAAGAATEHDRLLLLGLAGALAAAAEVLSAVGAGGRAVPWPAHGAGQFLRESPTWSRSPLPEGDQ